MSDDVTRPKDSLEAVVRRLRKRFDRALAKTGRTVSSIIRSRNRLREKEKSETMTTSEKKALRRLRKIVALHAEWFQARLRFRMFGQIERRLARAEKRKTPNESSSATRRRGRDGCPASDVTASECSLQRLVRGRIPKVEIRDESTIMLSWVKILLGLREEPQNLDQGSQSV